MFDKCKITFEYFEWILYIKPGTHQLRNCSRNTSETHTTIWTPQGLIEPQNLRKTYNLCTPEKVEIFLLS